MGGSQAFYDWNGINQANANGNHQAVVPDGKLCSGNNPTFRGLDVNRSDWQTTPIHADANGKFTFVFKATAPHATRDWRFFVTRDGWQPGSPLRWADLQEFCTLGNTPLSADGTYKLQCTLPQRTGQHVIYNTWQRSDSTEAFYTCMDVRLKAAAVVRRRHRNGRMPARSPPAENCRWVRRWHCACSMPAATMSNVWKRRWPAARPRPRNGPWRWPARSMPVPSMRAWACLPMA